VPRQQVIDRELLELLCLPMTETERARRLGVTRAAYYRHLDRLGRQEVIRPRGFLEPGMTLKAAHPRSRHSGTHHAPVQHISWDDVGGLWEAQGQLLDRWTGEDTNNVSITVRRPHGDALFTTARFEVVKTNRWSTADTSLALPPSWDLSYASLKNLTVVVARLIDADAVLIPGNGCVG
jgi:hypothetical protein